MAIPARPTPTANVKFWSTGISTVPATPGLEAAPPAPTRILRGRTQRRKCCVSFWRIRAHSKAKKSSEGSLGAVALTNARSGLGGHSSLIEEVGGGPKLPFYRERNRATIGPL